MYYIRNYGRIDRKHGFMAVIFSGETGGSLGRIFKSKRKDVNAAEERINDESFSG